MTFEPGQIVLNKYRVVKPLRRGQFGEVYLVFNMNMSCESALKIVHVENPESHRAVVEAQAQSLCGHDHVVQVRTADVFQSAVLIEMEFIPGGSLEDRLISEFVPIVDSVSFMKHVLFALEFAHLRGIVHRDVKPANIMLVGQKAKLSDFGTAIHPESGICATEKFYLPHASPEASEAGIFTAKSDVFASGMTLLRAANNTPSLASVTSSPEWRDHVAQGTLAKQIGIQDFVPRKLKKILNKALEPDPSERYPSASAMREDLERLRLGRRWVPDSPNKWSCRLHGKTEQASYEGGPNHRVVYRVNARLDGNLSRSHRSERDARAYLGKVIGSTTFL